MRRAGLEECRRAVTFEGVWNKAETDRLSGPPSHPSTSPP
jgi:hypothetical protein